MQHVYPTYHPLCASIQTSPVPAVTNGNMLSLAATVPYTNLSDAYNANTPTNVAMHRSYTAPLVRSYAA